MHELAVKYAKTPEQLFYAFVRSLGAVPLSGTTSQQHMRDDLEVMGHATGSGTRTRSGHGNARRHKDDEDGPALVLDATDVARIREGLQMT